MRIFLVGGAVRDKLLNLEVLERDWVVIGATPKEMLRLGYRAVGKSFPVYIHPKTSEQYALARSEKKTGKGYTGFSFDTDPSISLEEDLIRRDLTVNAIAEDSDGNIYDPHNGQQDLKLKVLRHVSSAFSEDPLRVLRVARFAARFAHLGFRVAEETMALMRKISKSDELKYLTGDRIWVEMQRALAGPAPKVFFDVLRNCEALSVILPEVDRLFGVPQSPKHHPEIDTGVHTMLALDQATHISDDPEIRFATVMHDIGKAQTPRQEWPHHKGHEQRGAELMEGIRARIPMPKEYFRLAQMTCALHTLCHRVYALSSKEVLDLFKQLDVRRRPKTVEKFLIACTADARGRKNKENEDYPQASYIRECAKAICAIKLNSNSLANKSADEIHALYQKQVLETIESIAQKT